MRRLTFPLLALCFAAATALAETAKPVIEDAEIDRYSLTLTFDQPMLTWSTPSTSTMLRLSPAVECGWYWRDDTTLACDRDRMEANDTDMGTARPYRLQVGEGLWSQAGEMLAPTTIELVANPPELHVTTERWVDGHPELELRGAMPLHANDIARLLDVRFDGEPLDYRLVPKKVEAWDDSGVSRFALQVANWPTTSGKLTMALRAGLRTPAGPAVGEASPHLYSVDINPAFALTNMICADRELVRVQGDAPLACPPGAEILLMFSQEPDDDALAALHASLPPALFAIPKEPRDCRYRCGQNPPRHALAIRILPEAAGTSHNLEIGAWTSRRGDVLTNPRRITLLIADHPPAYELTPEVVLATPGDIVAPALSARNVAQRDHWVELAVGARVRSRVTELAPTGPKNEFTVVPTPPLDRDIARKGGLLLSGLREQSGIARAMIVAPFNLLASQDPRGVLAWATDWTTGEGLPQAEIELLALTLDGRQTVLAQGRTDEGGAVYLAHAADAADATAPLLLVRARHRGRTSVLLVWEASKQSVERLPARDDEDDSGMFSASADEGGVLNFGVTERLLYRPGDTVRYRAWVRERQGNRLLAQAPADEVGMKLFDAWGDKVHDDWTATLDAFGSVAGEVPLSAQLADGDYCIRPAQDGEDGLGYAGACFRVARFDAQPSWATLEAAAHVLRPRETLQLDLEGGYFAGGPTANARLRIMGLLTPASFTDAYPDYDAFSFIEPIEGGEGETDPLAHATLPTQVDEQGRRRLVVALPDDYRDSEDEDASFAFGLMQFNGYLRQPGQPETASQTAKVYYAKYGTYVGLRSRGLTTTRVDPQLEAVLVTHDGKALPGQQVQVRIEHRPDKAGEAPPVVLARCTLVSGTAAACPFRAPEEGVYSVIAESGTAAPTAFSLYVSDRPEAPVAEPSERVQLEVIEASDGHRPARLRLHQPHERATALFVVEYGRYLRHWVQEVGRETEFDLAVRPEWAPGVSVRVMLRPRLESGDDDTRLAAEPGYRKARASKPVVLTTPTLDAIVRVALPESVRGRVALQVERTDLAPADTLVLTLRNESDATRLVTVSVVDDASHQQVQDLHPMLDPDGPRFLHALRDWSPRPWFGLQGWQWLRNPFHVPGQASQVGEFYGYGRGGELDSIEVTGSRISRTDIFEENAASVVLPPSPAMQPGAKLARVRSHFPDAAYWNPGVELAPGESRELRVALPDNLTRWRVLAWSGDKEDGFNLEQATVTTSLAVELRTGLPSHLYEGDQATGEVSARINGEQPGTVQLAIQADGAGVAAKAEASGRVAAFDVLSARIPLAPDSAGDIGILARANAATDSDAVSSAVTVHSRVAKQTVTQTGWLTNAPVNLQTPALPDSASDTRLTLTVALGYDGWQRDWIASLREYPHRCWEQTLSRSLGAALALNDPVAAKDWPLAQEEITQALRSAPAFQDEGGRYLFFASDAAREFMPSNPSLSAYTLRTYSLLAKLGQPVPERLVEPLLERLAGTEWDDNYEPAGYQLDHLAATVGAVTAAGGTPDATLVHELWLRWQDLSWYGRSELTRALAATPDQPERTREALDGLHAAGELRGHRRVIVVDRDLGAIMGSSLRDHCAVTATLWDLDDRDTTLASRQQHLRGLQDLYAGGTASLDSQASAHCLLALRAAGLRDRATDATQTVGVVQSGRSQSLRVDAQAPSVSWNSPSVADALSISASGEPAADLTYQATVDYRYDQAEAVASATGFRLQRAYSVLRGGKWVPFDGAAVHEGDWIRVTLRLQVPALRHYVALTDAVPGGWATRDIRLGGVAGADVQHVGDPGSWWFSTRQTGAGQVRLYAESLPPGSHEVHYFAQATHAGRYFAPPAVAELMYGRSSRATTDPAYVRINAAK